MPLPARVLAVVSATGFAAAVLTCPPAAAAPAVATSVTVHADTSSPVLHADAWLVADLSTGAILAASNEHAQLRPASTLKTLTAVTLLPRLDPDAVYRVQWADAAVEGSAVGIVPGATYTVDQLFYGLFLPSGNDAAHALASAAGGFRYTVRLMQQEATALGALDTVVRNPSGLDARGQVTSAYDLALFAKAGLARPDFRRYATTVTVPFPAEMPRRQGAERKTFQIYNQNPLVLDGYPGVLGVKTGYTTLAGRTFVGAAQRHGHLLVVTMLGYTEPTDVAAERLLDWGFRHLDTEPVGYLVGAGHADQPRSAVTAQGTGSATTAGLAVGHPLAQTAAWLVVVVGVGAAAAALVAMRRSRGSRQGSLGSASPPRE